MNYTLNSGKEEKKKALGGAWDSLAPLLADERGNLAIAFIAIIVNSASNLLAPIVIAHVIDTAIATHNFGEVVRESVLLGGVYVIGLIAGYLQTIRMGGVGRGVLFKLRNALFTKLSSLPVAFFNANKTGDLISRINNDTDKLNQFFGQALMQFVGSFFVILGAGVLLLAFNWKLGIAALIPAAAVVLITRLLSPWVKATNRAGLQSLGALSAEVSESLANFKVIVAFNRVDYFRQKFDEANQRNYRASIASGIASNIFQPVYTIAANIAQILVLGYGILLIEQGQLTIGLLIGYLLYVTSFYNPLRQLASVWASLQQALASLDRIQEVLVLESDLPVIAADITTKSNALLAFNEVSFGYVPEKMVLHDVSLELEKGKTYALVGPTGGGKTTTASMMARLFDPTSGVISLNGRDIRSYEAAELTKKIGFILQEPFLFSGTVGDNIVYGNADYAGCSEEALSEVLKEKNLHGLLERFPEGLGTRVTGAGATISLGQRQLIAFIRAVLRAPDLLILDEATANIDTVTEQLLEEVLAQLPDSTTKVIIAHRLNTIQSADSIFFVNAGTVTEAGSMDHAVDLLLHGKRVS